MLLFPFAGISLCLVLWSQWFPPQGPAGPHEPFVRRLGSSLRHGLEAWVLFDMVGTAVPRFDVLNEESDSSPGYRAVVNITENHGQIWENGTDEEVPLLPKVWETSLQLLTPMTSAIAVYEVEDRLTDLVLLSPVEIPSPPTRILGAFVDFLVRELSEVYWWAWIPGLLTLLAYLRRLCLSPEGFVSRMLVRLKGSPQIARVQRVNVVADGATPPSSLSYNETEVVALIANMRGHADAMEQWLMELRERRELESAAALSDDFDDICLQQAILEQIKDEPMEVPSLHPCNAAQTETLTEDVHTEPVLRPTDTSAEAETLELPCPPAPAVTGQETPSVTDAEPVAPPTPPATTSPKRRIRRSQAARRRAVKRAEKQANESRET